MSGDLSQNVQNVEFSDVISMVYLTIIPRACVGYEMISNKREWNNCFIKNAKRIAIF